MLSKLTPGRLSGLLKLITLKKSSKKSSKNLLKKTFLFAAQLGKKAAQDDLFSLSNELAYKILLSFFPFMVFLVTLLGFLNLENSPFVARLYEALPMDIGNVVKNFATELQSRPPKGILSISLMVSIYSASNGFRAVIRGVNKAHDYKDNRSFIKKTALCAGLMLIFCFSIIIMLSLWIFSDALLSWLAPHFSFNITMAAKLASAVIALAVLVAATAWMYYLACARHGTGKILPGACATVILWAVSSEIFSIFISQYSNISVIYGSIAGIFILIVWLNLISFFLLLGNSVNALLNSL